MPELPEVETIRRQLKEVLVGNKLVKVEVLSEKSFVGAVEELIDMKILDVRRKSKVMEIIFDNNLSLLVHLKMTGQLIYTEKTKKFKNSKTQNEEKRIVGGHPTADWVSDLPSKHTRVVLVFGDSSKLFFNDMRKFGWMKVIEKTQKIENSKNQPPDVVDEEFTVEYLEGVLIRSKRAVKLTILDQNLMGGIGNIYANDALFLSGVMPNRKANSLSHEEVRRLHQAIIKVINLGIETGGASAANYVDTRGMGGTYQNHFLVYKRDGLPCKKCGEKILKITLGGRGTFYCPKCQK